MELSGNPFFNEPIQFDVIDVEFRFSYYARSNGCLGAQVIVVLPAKPVSEKDSTLELDPRLQSTEKQIAGERLSPEWGEAFSSEWGEDGLDAPWPTHYRFKAITVESPCGINFLKNQIKEFVGETNQTIRSIANGKEAANTEENALWEEDMRFLTPHTYIYSFLFFPKVKIE